MSTPLRLAGPDPWTDGHDWNATRYERSFVHQTGTWSGWVGCADPLSRVGVTYNPNQNLNPTNMRASGMCYLGIGCHYRETGLTHVRVAVDWANHHEAPWHFEATPLVHVVPGTQSFGFGAWLSGFGVGPQAWLVGVLGNPPEYFDVLDIGAVSTPDGVPQRIALESDNDVVTVWLNGVQQSLLNTGLNGVPLPTELKDSTLHGAAYDSHLIADVAAIPTRPAWRNWSCEELAA